MSAAKRARVAEAVTFDQLDLSKLTIRKREASGKTYTDLLLDNDIPHINLTPGTSLAVKFGFDMTGIIEPRSFHPNTKLEKEPKPHESLSLGVTVDGELEATLVRLDDRCRELYAEAGLEGEWKPLVSEPHTQFKRYAKLQVGLKGDCADLRIQDGDELKQGSGWDFMQACEASVCNTNNECERGFSYAKVKVSAKLRLWSVAGKCGISLAPIYLVIKPQPKPKAANPFADDIEW
jgi:hypothetical protein